MRAIYGLLIAAVSLVAGTAFVGEWRRWRRERRG